MTGVARHASTAAFASIRALTSHLRRLYHTRYKTQYRFSRIAFGFDGVLVGIVVTLLVLEFFLLLLPPQIVDGGLALTLSLPPVRASDAVPIEVVVRATDDKRHEHVTLRWQLPEWVEILRASPAIDKRHTMTLDTISPQQEKRAYLVVRVRALPGTRVPFRFLVSQDDVLGLTGRLVGADTRTVASTALSALPALEAARVVPNAVLPVRIRNASSLSVASVILRLTQKDGAPQATFVSGGTTINADGNTVFFGTLAPTEERTAYLSVHAPEAPYIRLAWHLQDGPQNVDAQQVVYAVATSSAAWMSDAWQVQLSRAPQSIKVTNVQARAGRLFIDHPGTHDRAAQNLRILPDMRDTRVPLREDFQSSPAQRWTTVIVDDALPGGTLGPPWGGFVSTEFPLKTIVRYYAASGDQLGLGPLPPRVGQETRYWVLWQIGPNVAGLKHIQLETSLPAGVRATGKFASEHGGSFSVEGTVVRWNSLNSVPSKGDTPATVSFEIGFVPTPKMVGTVATLVATTTVEGISMQDGGVGEEGVVLRSAIGGETTMLKLDTRANQKGIIQ